MSQPRTIEFHPEASEEIRAAQDWYRQRSPETARAFAVEFAAGVEKIRSAPHRWPGYHFGTRRYRLHRFPYLLIYRAEAARVHVVAVAHAKRRPGYWKSRAT